MRNVVVGSFIGFVLAAAFLAACGGGSTVLPAANRPAVTGEVRWTQLGDRHTVANGLRLTGGDIWRSGTVYENAATDGRNRWAMFEIAGTVGGSAAATIEIGILPAPDGTHFATTPQWVGAIQLDAGSNARSSLYGIPLVPARFKVALRLSGGGGTVLLSLIELTPYNELDM